MKKKGRADILTNLLLSENMARLCAKNHGVRASQNWFHNKLLIHWIKQSFVLCTTIPTLDAKFAPTAQPAAPIYPRKQDGKLCEKQQTLNWFICVPFGTSVWFSGRQVNIQEQSSAYNVKQKPQVCLLWIDSCFHWPIVGDIGAAFFQQSQEVILFSACFFHLFCCCICLDLKSWKTLYCCDKKLLFSRYLFAFNVVQNGEQKVVFYEKK